MPAEIYQLRIKCYVVNVKKSGKRVEHWLAEGPLKAVHLKSQAKLWSHILRGKMSSLMQTLTTTDMWIFYYCYLNCLLLNCRCLCHSLPLNQGSWHIQYQAHVEFQYDHRWKRWARATDSCGCWLLTLEWLSLFLDQAMAEVQPLKNHLTQKTSVKCFMLEGVNFCKCDKLYVFYVHTCIPSYFLLHLNFAILSYVRNLRKVHAHKKIHVLQNNWGHFKGLSAILPSFGTSMHQERNLAHKKNCWSLLSSVSLEICGINS